jgi:hypothetical protein
MQAKEKKRIIENKHKNGILALTTAAFENKEYERLYSTVRAVNESYSMYSSVRNGACLLDKHVVNTRTPHGAPIFSKKYTVQGTSTNHQTTKKDKT